MLLGNRDADRADDGIQLKIEQQAKAFEVPYYALTQGILLDNGRYVVRRAINVTPKAVLYEGYDIKEDRKVLIEEFFPVQLAVRNESGQVEHRLGFGPQYKTMVEDYTYFNTTLKSITRLPKELFTVETLLREKGTVYCVCRHVDFIPIGAVYEGPMAWLEVKRLIMPLLNTVSTLHKNGIVHGEISPETIVIDKNKKLYIIHFPMEALRIYEKNRPANPYEWCVPPEAKSRSGAKGTYTDVYALAAVMYHLITGKEPGAQQGTLPWSTACPKKVMAALSLALRPDYNKRTQTMDDLVAALLESQDSNTAIFTGSVQPASVKKNNKLRVGFAMVAAVILIAVSGLAVFISRGIEGPGVSSEYVPTIYDNLTEEKRVPRFIGQTEGDVRNNTQYNRDYQFYYIYEYSSRYASGVIMDQAPRQGVLMYNKGMVILTVSKGTEIAAVPALTGLDLSIAKRMLDDLGINYTLVGIEDDEADYGEVLYTEPSYGTVVERGVGRVVVYYNKKENVASSSGSSQSSQGRSESSQ